MRTLTVALTICVMAVAFCAATAPSAQAALLLSDNFNDADGGDYLALNRNLAARQSGTLATLNWVRSSNTPVYGVQVDHPTDGADVMVTYSFEPDQKYNVARLDHSFTDAAIISAGGFAIDVDVTPIAHTDGTKLGGSWTSITLGAPTADKASAAWDSDVDFALLLRDNGFVSVLQGGQDLGINVQFDSTPTYAETYAVHLDVNTNNFATGYGATVGLSVNGTQIDLGSAGAFNWDYDGTNYIGYGLTYGDAFCYSKWDNLSISTAEVPEPSTLVLLAAGLFGLLCYAWRKRK